MPYLPPEPNTDAALKRFSRLFKSARLRSGQTQSSLERATGVDQTAVSRLEHAKAAHFPLERLLALSEGMRGELPIGECPHDHDCKWKEPAGEIGRLPPWRPDRESYLALVRASALADVAETDAAEADDPADPADGPADPADGPADPADAS